MKRINISTAIISVHIDLQQRTINYLYRDGLSASKVELLYCTISREYYSSNEDREKLYCRPIPWAGSEACRDASHRHRYNVTVVGRLTFFAYSELVKLQAKLTLAYEKVFSFWRGAKYLESLIMGFALETSGGSLSLIHI